MFAKALRKLKALLVPGRRWAQRTLAVGPIEPVDGDSVSCTKALLNHLRSTGREAWTLPTINTYVQLSWILQRQDIHPACLAQASENLTTNNTQKAFDSMLEVWKPEEIVLLDGPPNRLGFDPRGVPIFTIDHHMDAGARHDREAYIQPAPSTGCLLIEHFGIFDPILVVSILTDTYWLRQNQPAKAVKALEILRTNGGLTDDLLIDIQRKLIVYKDPAIISALNEAELRCANSAVFVVLRESSPEVHRGVMGELGYFFQHICLVRGDGYVSFKTTDPALSLRPLAQRWHGGGHDNKAAGHLPSLLPTLLDELYVDFMTTVNHGA